MITKTCAVSGQQFIVTDEDLAFYQKMDVPVPTLCPRERFRRRLTWRHGGDLFKVECDGTKKPIISQYPQERPFPVYEQNYWWGDDWSALDYGRDFDFSRPFFDQFVELYNQVPHISLVNHNAENSYYTNHALNHKDCYLIFGGAHNEDCLYGYFLQNCTNVVDGDCLVRCELCFNASASSDCYSCAYVTYCRSCQDCFLCQDCQSCQDCIACVGLGHKKYHILNKAYSPQDYERIKSELRLDTRAGWERMFAQYETLQKDAFYPYGHLYNCEDSTGDRLYHCKNCKDCFDSRESENCRYVSFTPNGLESYDCTFSAPVGVRFCYEVISTLGERMMSNMLVWHCNDVMYSAECHNSHDLFGCAGLKRKEYCILNKQMTVHEYTSTQEKIIAHMRETGEWGEFFPGAMSPYAYNHSMAQRFLPLTQEACSKQGFAWYEAQNKTQYIGPESDLAESIYDVDDEVVNQVLTCKATGKSYRILKQELSFYRQVGLPIPDCCPDHRHEVRMRLRNPRELWRRKCTKCSAEIESSFSPDRPEKVLCESCYLATIN